MQLLVLGAIACAFFIGLALLGVLMSRREERRADRLNRALSNLEAPASAGAKLMRSRIRANWLISDTHDEPPSNLDRWDSARYRIPDPEIAEVPQSEDTGAINLGDLTSR